MNYKYKLDRYCSITVKVVDENGDDIYEFMLKDYFTFNINPNVFLNCNAPIFYFIDIATIDKKINELGFSFNGQLNFNNHFGDPSSIISKKVKNYGNGDIEAKYPKEVFIISTVKKVREYKISNLNEF